MTRDDVRAWLDRYVAAWESYDPTAIGALFSVDAEYRFHPSDDPITGRDAIVGAWVDPTGVATGRDEPGTCEAHDEPWAVEGPRAVAVGRSRYFTDARRSTIDQVFDNAFLLEFDAAGARRSFTEFFRERP